MNKDRLCRAAVGLALMARSAATGAPVQMRWERHHPRRDQVNDRLENQKRRIGRERRESELTRAQAQDLRAEDRGVRAQERYDVSLNHGHITRAEQRMLSGEEDAVSRQLGR